MMFGYACDETPELMPLAITLAHALAASVGGDLRQAGRLAFVQQSDAKSQVTIRYQMTARRGSKRGGFAAA